MADSKEKEELARNAQALAEKYFLAGNVSAARQWMQSAVRLAPDLPGTPQLAAAYDVHAAAAARSSRPNWYAVLGLKPGPALTHDDIKKQHRRLCLLVHPDKNPSAAADGAFKLVHAAWEVLSVRHPPHATVVPAPADQPTPPPPPPPQAAPPTRRQPKAQQRRRTKPRPAEPKPPTSQQANMRQHNKCAACGAQSFNGRNNYRCMSCLWSPMDDRHQRHEDDYDDRHEQHEDDDDFFDY